MNIPNCIIKDQKYISTSSLEHHQSLAKRLYNSSKKIKSLDSSSQNPMNNYSKKRIFKWLFNLDLKTRINICSIYNNWFSKILFQLLTYKEYDGSIRFIPKRPYESFYKKIKPDFDEDNFDYNIYINYIIEKEKKVRIIKDEDEFKCKDNYHNFFEGVSPDNRDKHNNKNQVREKDFLKELRFYTLNDFNDTFTLSFELLNSKTKLQEYFDTFSNCKIFSENIISTKKNNNIYNFSFPNWVTEHKSFSVQQIIIICFEQIISFYYQIFLLDGVIPNFEIDSKIKEMLNMNENIENYLAKKLNNDFFNKELITKEVNSEKYLNIIKDNEIKSENVYVIAFDRERSQFFIDEEIKSNEIENTLEQLKIEYNKNISKFVNNISFIVASSAFKTKNIIYNIIYQQISSLCRKRNIDELYMNIDDDKPKNKKRRKKNKKNNTNIKKYDNNNDKEKNEINYINIDEQTKERNENNDNDKYNNLNNNYNSINNEENKNNINNNSDEDEDNFFSNDYYDKNPESIERIYQLKGEKSEKKEEQLIEMKELNKNGKEIIKNEEKEKEKNNSELLEEIMRISKKKKKRKRKKNIDNNINNENNLDNNKEKEEEEEKNENNVKDNKDIKKINNNIQNIEEIKNENKLKDDKIDKLNIKDEEDKNNKKKHKEFFLFPIEHNKKKKGKKNKSNKENNIINNNKELKNESDKDKENDKMKYTLNKTTISKKNENNDGNEINDIKSNNKNDLLIETKESKIEFTGVKQTSKKNKIDNNNTINILDNQNNMDYLTEFNKNQIVNSNSPIINNYIIIEKNSFKNSSPFIDNYNHKMNNPSFNNMFLQSHNPGFQNNYYPPLMGPFNYQVPYQQLPNYSMNEQPEFFNDLSNELLLYEESVYNNLDILKKYREDILINIKNYIENILKENNFDVQLINYGSFETKLSIEISDIDILIKFCKKNNKVNDINQQHIENILSLLYEKINNDKEKYQIIVVNAIYTASVPVLKIKCSLESIIPDDIKNKLKEKYIFNFEEDILHLNFDFTFLEVNNIKEEKNIPSLEIVSYIKNILNNYKEIKPIILFLKRYMCINRLNSSFHGGLSSYSLFLLVYAFFKYANIYLKSLNTSGQYLYSILDFYSNFIFGINSINVNLSNPYVILNELHECGMMIIDPLTKLNVAKSTFRVDQIKSVLTKGVVIIRNIIYKKFFENNNYNVGNGNNIYLEELFKSKNGTIIFEEMNSQIIQNQVSIGKWM